MAEPQVAIVDYGMGNLFSVKQACERAGLRARITPAPAALLEASAVILPGVGAFGDAIAALRRSGLDEALREVAASGKPLLGICLGMQLLMSQSAEFGAHRGLGIIPGDVVRLDAPTEEAGTGMNGARRSKVPQIGWNQIDAAAPWEGSLLEGLADGAHMYFVHSFYARPGDPEVRLSTTRYGPTTFCSSLRSGSIFACQFHPERSGPLGLRIYQNFAARLLQLAGEGAR